MGFFSNDIATDTIVELQNLGSYRNNTTGDIAGMQSHGFLTGVTEITAIALTPRTGTFVAGSKVLLREI